MATDGFGHLSPAQAGHTRSVGSRVRDLEDPGGSLRGAADTLSPFRGRGRSGVLSARPLSWPTRAQLPDTQLERDIPSAAGSASGGLPRRVAVSGSVGAVPPREHWRRMSQARSLPTLRRMTRSRALARTVGFLVLALVAVKLAPLSIRAEAGPPYPVGWAH